MTVPEGWHLRDDECTDQTRLFVMSLPVGLLECSIGKMAVVLAIFLFLLAGFCLQLTTAVAFEFGRYDDLRYSGQSCSA